MITHKERMVERRLRQRARRVGFIPVVNQRHQATLTALRATGSTEEQAWAAIARTLPATPIGVRQNPFRSTSKYNQENTKGNR